MASTPMYLRDQLTGEVIFDEFGNSMIIGVRAMLNTDDELYRLRFAGLSRPAFALGRPTCNA